MNDCNTKCWWKFEWFSDSILRLSSRQKRKIVLLWSMNMCSSWFSNKNDDLNNDVEYLISDRITKFLIRSLLRYSVWCFLDDLNLIWWLNRVIFVINKWYSESESTLEKKLFVNLDYRVNSSVLNVNWRRRTSLLCFVFVYIHNEFTVVCFDAFFE